jgi:peptide chain release factor 2
MAATADDLERQATSDGFWDDNERAQKVLKEKGQIERVVNDWRELSRLRDDVGAAIELGEELGDPSLADEAAQQLAAVDEKLKALEVRRILSAPEDKMDAIVEINAGAGGTDAADFADMLVRMYARWAERQGLQTEVLDLSPAEPYGIRAR